MEAKLGKPPIIPIIAKLLLTNSFFLLLQTRMVLHPIYQQLLEGDYAAPSLSATTERMLRHPIYQQPLEGGYDLLVYQLLLKVSSTPNFHKKLKF